MPSYVSARVGDEYSRILTQSILPNQIVSSGALPPGVALDVTTTSVGGSTLYIYALRGRFAAAGIFGPSFALRQPGTAFLIGANGEYPFQILFSVQAAAPTTPGGVEIGVRLSWFQARAEARAGVRIRRAGWVDKWLERTLGFWWVQFINPTTKVLGTRRVVEASDMVVADFFAGDWTWEGIPGQPATAGAASALVPPTLAYPP